MSSESAPPFRGQIKFVYFDLDDTLLDHRGAEKRALTVMRHDDPALQRFISTEKMLETYHRINVETWRRYSEAKISKDRARVERFERLLQLVDVDDPAHSDELGHRYLSEYSQHWSWLAGAREAFLEVSGQKRVGILTNGFAEVQRQKMRQFPVLLEHASATVISEEAGYMKPDIRVFQHATQQAGVDPSEVLYVGDSFRSDVEGGTRAGWNVAWLAAEQDHHQTASAHVTFSAWEQFHERVGRWL